jgi:predicted RNA-binding Zn ribbon-like protein
VGWGTRAVDAHQIDRLHAVAQRDPEAANAAFEAARALREKLYRVFSSIAAASTPASDDVQALNREHAHAMAHARIVPIAGGYVWDWDEDPHGLDRMLWPIVRDAADLLTTGRLGRIRECPGADGCGWLFYDTSRNGKRRWCSMDGCGNRSKGRRHYRRRAAATTPESVAAPKDPAGPHVVDDSEQGRA